MLFSCLGISVADSNNVFDTCPTAANRTEFINGYHCKSPTIVTTSDFYSAKLTGPVYTDDRFNLLVKIVTAADFPGLNTLGLSISRTDLHIDAIVSPHSHPRATEMFFLNQGMHSQSTEIRFNSVTHQFKLLGRVVIVMLLESAVQCSLSSLVGIMIHRYCSSWIH